MSHKFKKYHEITIYTGGTKLCELTKEYFWQAGYEFKELDIQNDRKNLDEMMLKGDVKDPPVVDIDGRIIVGYHPEMFELALGIADEDADSGSSSEPKEDGTKSEESIESF